MTHPVSEPLEARTTPLWQWAAQGLRAAFFLAPRVTGALAPWQLLVLVLLPLVLVLGLGRAQIVGPADFHPAAALNVLWPYALALWVGWWTLSGAPVSSLGRWFALSSWAGLPWSLLMSALAIAYYRGWLPAVLTTAAGFWAAYCALLGAWFVSAVWLMARHVPTPKRLAVFIPCLLALTALETWQSIQEREGVWRPDYSASTGVDRPRLELTQEVFEAQQAAWQRAVTGLAARPEGAVPQVFGLVFAPYASEDVFLRESAMVAGVIEERFDAKGRVLRLVNHATTAEDWPWATPLNLQRAVQALAARMDREHDILMVYLSSHGVRDFQLAAANWPLSVPGLTPQQLREALDAAGVRHRVVAVSACYSGGWIEPLATEDSLVMTAADATHTSYGCGRRSELTFFGRAMFDEQLRKTRSLEDAFAAAAPLIREREVEAGKDDGFSNPQIHVGERIRPLLQRLSARLDGG